ncbi:unnamed protein product [Linum trigynum]|uniref:Gnk2-homologous domain-containing protein n=1 Tax=Linum trigynum TaxID=586398 RepID=A0AAV2DQW8_9ROSI
MIVVVAVVLVVVSLRSQSASANVISYLCNDDLFDYDDLHIECVYILFDKLVGDARPVKQGAWYLPQTCSSDDSVIVYGYRRMDEGATDCISDAEDDIVNIFCRHRTGGQAWGDGCYLRFEIYPFDV